MLTDPLATTGPAVQSLGWRYLFATAPFAPDECTLGQATPPRPPVRQTLATLRLWWEELRQAHIAHARAVIHHLAMTFGPDGVPPWAYVHLEDARAGRLRHPTSHTVMQLPPDEAVRLGRVA